MSSIWPILHYDRTEAAREVLVDIPEGNLWTFGTYRGTSQ
jgi:hypothetical protein